LLCLPTYEERENLPAMIEALAEVRKRTPVAGDVLVIDDSSPDGTGELADELARTHDWVHVLHRPRTEGLGRAYRDGFRWALRRDYAYVLEMDCDFSHPPGRVVALLETASADADLVLGSRYVAGGGVEDWSFLRRVISRGGCLYAR